MLQAAQSLLPIALMTALGAALLWSGFFHDKFRQELDQFTYWVALPCLFVSELAEAEFAGSGALGLTLVLVIATLLAALVSAGVAGIVRLPWADFGVFVQASFRSNLVFVGLSIVIFALSGSGRTDVESMVIIALAPLYNVTAVLVLLMAEHQLGWSAVPKLIKTLVTNSLIIAGVVGGLLAGLGWPLPVPLARTLEVGRRGGNWLLGRPVMHGLVQPLLPCLASRVLRLGGDWVRSPCSGTRWIVRSCSRQSMRYAWSTACSMRWGRSSARVGVTNASPKKT